MVKKLIYVNKDICIDTETMMKSKGLRNNTPMVGTKIKFIDLFAGTGAFSLALEKSDKFKSNYKYFK